MPEDQEKTPRSNGKSSRKSLGSWIASLSFFSFTKIITRGLRFLFSIILAALTELGNFIFKNFLLPLYRFLYHVQHFWRHLLPNQPNREWALSFLITGAVLSIGAVVIDRQSEPVRGEILTTQSLAGLFLAVPEEYG